MSPETNMTVDKRKEMCEDIISLARSVRDMKKADFDRLESGSDNLCMARSMLRVILRQLTKDLGLKEEK